MIMLVPNYYKDFLCIADKCRHSCCIGWEIDIDEETLEFYELFYHCELAEQQYSDLTARALLE